MRRSVAALLVALVALPALAEGPAAPVPQAQPELSGPFTARAVARARALVRRGPDPLAEVTLVVAEGTLLAAAPGPVRGFVRVRVAGGSGGWVAAREVALGDGAEASWAAPAAVALPGAAPEGYLGEPTPTGGRLARTHDGLLARLEVGGGWMGSRADLARQGNFPRGADVTGSSLAAALTVGTAVRENLVLGLQAWGMTGVRVRNDVSLPGEWGLYDVGTVDGSARLSLLALGPAASLYASPSNLHLTLAAGVTWIHADTRAPLVGYPFYWMTSDQYLGKPYDPGLGLGARLTIGKEWWVRDDAGLGLAASYAWSWNPDDAWSGKGWRTSVLTFGLSATWN